MVTVNPKVRGIFFWKGKYPHWIPRGLTIKEKLWWYFMPGVVINVAWPKGQIRVGPSHRQGWSGVGPEFEYVDSADPNDHYRPWMEQHVGRQGWDWNWGMAGNNVTENMLTIKFRKSKEKYATLATILWS
jgi:hypothetical protein